MKLNETNQKRSRQRKANKDLAEEISGKEDEIIRKTWSNKNESKVNDGEKVEEGRTGEREWLQSRNAESQRCKCNRHKKKKKKKKKSESALH
jgi:hypothetical protein